MKKIFLIGLVIFALAVVASGCTTIENKYKFDEMKKGALFSDALSMEVVFYEKNNEALVEKNNDFSKSVKDTFEKKFRDVLEKSDIRIKAPIKIKTTLIYRVEQVKLAEARFIDAHILVIMPNNQIEISKAAGAPIYFPSLTIGGPDVLAKRLSNILAEYLAEDLIKKIKN